MWCMVMLALVELYQYNIVTGTIQYQSLNTKATMIVMVMTAMIRRALQIAEIADVYNGSGGDSEPKNRRGWTEQR